MNNSQCGWDRCRVGIRKWAEARTTAKIPLQSQDIKDTTTGPKSC